MSGYEYPSQFKTKKLIEVFDIVKGLTPASNAIDDGDHPFITTASDIRFSNNWQIDGEAIVIPTVSSTGHGHASINKIHYINSKFALATICVALIPKSKETNVRFYYQYFKRFKDQLLVPMMRGSANVSLNVDRLGELDIICPSLDFQESLVNEIAKDDENIKNLERELEELKKHRINSEQNFGSDALGKIVH